MFELVVRDGPDAGRVFVLIEAEATIGRDLDNAVALNDAKVSRRHARIFSSEGVWRLEDLASRNGTWVDGRRVTSLVQMPARAVIRVGSTVLQFVDTRLPQVLPEEDRSPLPGETVEIPLAAISAERMAREERSAETLAVSSGRLRTLLAFAESSAASACVSIGDCLEAAVRAAVGVLAGARVIPILAEGDGRLRPWFSPEARFASLKELPISTSIVRHSLERRMALLVGSPEGGASGRSASMALHRIQTILAVPILGAPKSALGVLYADRTSPTDDFVREDLEWLISLAAILAGRIESIQALSHAHRSRALAERQLRKEHRLLGRSSAMQALLERIEKIAAAPSAVLVTGESGSGKELVARTIHAASPRREGPFEAVNCAALPEGVVESELFGHVKGAFTGAVADRLGRFELADTGTLFLDEVAELPEAVQAKLLRILEDGRVRRLGDTRDRKVDVRLVAATHRDLAGAVREGKFREDLFFRLNVLAVSVPPLRERPEDISELAAHFLERFSNEAGKRRRALDAAALAALSRYGWPGNVRELKNTIERMVVLSDRELLSVSDLPPEIRAPDPSRLTPRPSLSGYSPALSLDEVEADHIRACLAHHGNNRSAAAATLGIDRSTLYAKLKRYGITAP